MKPPRFLVLRGGAIGDFIVTLPVLRALRERWPDMHLELIGYPHISGLAAESGLVDRLDSLDRAHIARFFALKPVFTPEQSEYIRSFDVVINFLHDPGGVVRENLELAGARLVLSGSPLVRDRHAIDQMLQPLESLAIYAAGAECRLDPVPAWRAEGERRLVALGVTGAPLVIHPGSGSPKKNWPADRFAAAAGRVSRVDGWPVVFLAGEADAAAIAAVRAADPGARVVEGLDLTGVAGLLSAARAYLGNDSGISHLAAALGIPSVVLFGPSDPALWAPRGAHVRILRADRSDLARLPVDDVCAALAGLG